MNRPNESGEECQPAAAGRRGAEGEKQFFKEEKKSSRSGAMHQDAGDVIRRGVESERAVFEGVGQALQGPIKIGGGRVDEEEVIKSFRYQPPAANERVSQDEGRIVPNETVANGGRIAGYNSQEKQKNRENSLHSENGLNGIDVLASKVGNV